MNRTLLSEAVVVLAMTSVISCSDNSVTGPDGTNTDPLTTEESIVASVEVTLGSSSIQVADSTQASATVLNRRGTEIDRTVQWASSNPSVASVSSTGMVHALAVGSAAITATRRGIIGSATLSVGDSQSPPPTSGSSNEPTGMSVISDRPFNAINELGWDDNGGTHGTIMADANAPKSPPSFLRTTLPAGFHAGGGTYSGDLNFTASRTLYISYWARLSANWQGADAGIDKQFYVYTSTGVPSIIFAAFGVGSDPKFPLVDGQEILQGGQGYGDANNPDWGPNLIRSAQIPRGQWYQVEVVLVGNTAGNADGSVDFYLNGAHVGSYSRIQFTSGAARWSLFHYTNLWTGGSSVTTAAQSLDFDHIYLSGKN